jgi:NitT/TauT family transport system substrate-binding protein
MRRLLAAVLVCATLWAGAGCGGDAGAPASTPGQPDRVSAGVIAIVDVAPIYLGKQKGFFSKRNIDLTLETGQGGAAIVPGVLGGQFQFGFSNVTSLILAKSRDLPVKMVSNGVTSTGATGQDFGGVVVRPDSDIKAPADLMGRTVAVNTLKNIGDTTVRASVRKDGGDSKAVTFVEMGFPDMPAALQAGRVDAVWVVEPFLTIARTREGRPAGRVVAWNFVDAGPDLTVAAYFTSKQVIATNPDLVKRFTEAMTESLRYANEHPEEVRTVLGSYTQIDPNVTAKMTLPKWPAMINTTSVRALADLAVRDGLLDKVPNLTDLLP